MRTFMSRFPALVLTVCLLFMGMEALAKEAGNKSNTDTLQLESVTVTARKLKEDVREVPIGITVLDGQSIEDQGIASTVDIANFVPNLMLVENGVSAYNSPSMRGIHADVTTLTVSTGLYVDGVPYLKAAGYDDALLDIERVEVLRGPQGTLYGKNTEAGAINIVTRKPDNEFRGNISGELGEDNKRQLTFNVSGPIQKDLLYFGLAGKFYEKDGFIENTLTGDTENDKKHWYGKAQLRWTPQENLDIALIVSRIQYDDGGPNSNFTELATAMFNLPSPEDRKVSSDYPTSNESQLNTQSLKIDYNISDTLTLTSVTANWVYDDIGKMDYDFSPVKYYQTDKDSQFKLTSQEFRLASSGNDLKWLLGVYFDQNKDQHYTTTDSIVSTMVSTTNREFSGSAAAVFGQATLSLSKKLRLTGGLRYEKQETDYENKVMGTSYNKTWDEVSPKISMDYDLTPEIMTYFTVAKGYRSGGFNTYATDAKYVSYDEEKLMSYEIGAKSVMLNRRLSLSGAIFYMDIDDMLVSETDSVGMSYLTNAAKASGTGAELELTASLTDRLGLIASYGFTDIQFDEYSDAAGDYEGNKNPNVPEYTYNIGAHYRMPNGLSFRGDLVGYGKTYLGRNNTYSRDAYQLVNAKVGYERESWDVYLYGKNIFDTEYDSEGYYNGYYTTYSEPREIGVKGTYRF